MRCPRGCLLLVVLTGACSSGGASGADAGADVTSPIPDAGSAGDASAEAAPVPANYADPAMWLCGGGASPDDCLEPLTATAIHPDLSQAPVAITPATSPP